MTDSDSRDIAIVNLYGKRDDRPSTRRLRAIASRARTRYLLLNLDFTPLFITSVELRRIVEVMDSSGAAALFTDYNIRRRGEAPAKVCLDDYTPGSVREDFDFGFALAVDVAKMRTALGRTPFNYEFAGIYDLRLRLSRMDGGIFHLREPLYGHFSKDDSHDGFEAQFAYVDRRNAEAQKEFETAFTSHLKAIGAWLPPRVRTAEVDNPASFPVVASVVIPVRNRAATIADAVRSALAQKCDFDFNVLVVDNHSTDGTSDILRQLSMENARVVRIEPRNSDSGIGGCWNTAIAHRLCGAYAVQLDSDDLYSSADTLQRIVNLFREEKCAMVVGSYSLVDFDLNPIPPGVIDHREWTDANGHNNLLRVNGVGAPRAFATDVARSHLFPPVCYGEDYAMALWMSRNYRIGRIFEPLYLCRRWSDNSDAGLSREKAAANNRYKDMLREIEIAARQRMNRSRGHEQH